MIGLDVQAVRLERERGNHYPLMALFGQKEKWIRGIAERKLGRDLLGKISASDIAQEVWIDGYQKFGNFRGLTAKEFDSWLLKITLRRVGRARRKFLFTDKRSTKLEVPISWAAQKAGTDRSPSSIVGHRELLTRVQQAVRSLKEADRLVLMLHDRERLDYDEIARRLGTTEGAVRRRVARARVRVHRILEGMNS